jgi:hypothetical protein
MGTITNVPGIAAFEVLVKVRRKLGFRESLSRKEGLKRLSSGSGNILP